jgi:predicted lipid-binding transport protein (Tim44 family)
MARPVRLFVAFLSLFAVLAFAASDSHARPLGGFSAGSRGMRTYTAPPSTRTAPNAAAPIQRSVTPRTAPTAGPGSGFFGRGLFGGFFGGFLGAGLLGMLLGYGLFGHVGGFASMLGLLLQLALIAFLARLVWNWWQRRQAPAYAGGPSGASLRNMFSPGLSSAAGAGPAGLSSSIQIGQSDYEAFERLLGEIETAYGAEDLEALQRRVTPEMLSYFADDLAANASRGVVNRVGDVKLLQGDLAEAWREGGTEYATVAMRFALTDQMIDRGSGRVVEENPSQATELWTFRRTAGGAWLLSAIQQGQAPSGA